jgi:hypothetical protein
MSALQSIPKSVRGLPSVERVIDSLKSARRANSELREVAKDALSPGRATMGIQTGAFAHGVIEAVAGERVAPMVQWAAALGCLVGGVMSETPDLVMLANGLMAPMSSAQGYKLATAARRGDSPFPAQAK